MVCVCCSNPICCCFNSMLLLRALHATLRHPVVGHLTQRQHKFDDVRHPHLGEVRLNRRLREVAGRCRDRCLRLLDPFGARTVAVQRKHKRCCVAALCALRLLHCACRGALQSCKQTLCAAIAVQPCAAAACRKSQACTNVVQASALIPTLKSRRPPPTQPSWRRKWMTHASATVQSNGSVQSSGAFGVLRL